MYRFPLEADEQIIKKDYATLFCDDIYLQGPHLHVNTMEGVLYLTSYRLVFIGYMLAATTKHVEEIPLVHIKTVTPEKSLFVLPNALRIATIRQQEYVLVVRRRDEWLALINRQAELI